MTYVSFFNSTLINVNFTNADLTGAGLGRSTLTNANFSGAIISGAAFDETTDFTANQLYSTASYASGNLTGISLGSVNLTGWNFANQNLSTAYLASANLTSANFTNANLANANLYDSTLNNANFSGADIGGAGGWSPVGTTITHNTIRPDGSIQGLSLLAGEKLVIRNNPIAITVTTSASFDPASTLEFLLESNWTSPVGFAAGLNPALGGNLDLEFATGVNFFSQVGHTFQLFNWTGINPSGTFTVASPLQWDLSQLYTTGNVTLLSVPEVLGDFNGDGHVNSSDVTAMEAALANLHGYETANNITNQQLLAIGDLNGDGTFNNADLQALINLLNSGGGSTNPIPEPSTFLLAVLAFGLVTRRRFAYSK